MNGNSTSSNVRALWERASVLVTQAQSNTGRSQTNASELRVAYESALQSQASGVHAEYVGSNYFLKPSSSDVKRLFDTAMVEVMKGGAGMQNTPSPSARGQEMSITTWGPPAWLPCQNLPQRRGGGRRGRGSRPRGSSIEFRANLGPLFQLHLCSQLIEHDAMGRVQLQDFFSADAIEDMRETNRKGRQAIFKNYVACLPGFLLGICARFPNCDPPKGRRINPREKKHVICIWIDLRGQARCTCTGRTLFNLRSDLGDCSFKQPHCEHTKLAYSCFRNMFEVPDRSLEDVIVRMRGLAEKLTITVSSPVPQTLFKRMIHIYPETGAPDSGTTGPTWIPIRGYRKKPKLVTCAFCDTRSEVRCSHVQKWWQIRDTVVEEPVADNSQELLLPLAEDLEELLDKTYDEVQKGRSILPIAPVNCPASVQLDERLRIYLKEDSGIEVPSSGEANRGDTFVVSAPEKCPCGRRRDEGSRMLLSEGVSMTGNRPVKMRRESFRCQAATCNELMYEEGRRAHIVFYSYTSGATHAFMRREIQAVVLSGGTVSNRFATYLRHRREDRSSGIISGEITMRGMRSLTNLFALTLRLMVIDPPSKLFYCNNCFSKDGDDRLLAVCVDGIWAGFDRASAFPFVSVSEKCEAVQNSTGKRKANAGKRPDTCLFRNEKVTHILCSAISGERISVTDRNAGDKFAALRLMDPQIVPVFWTVDPIFASADNADEDRLRDLVFRATRSLFKTQVVAHRLAKAI